MLKFFHPWYLNQEYIGPKLYVPIYSGNNSDNSEILWLFLYKLRLLNCIKKENDFWILIKSQYFLIILYFNKLRQKQYTNLNKNGP